MLSTLFQEVSSLKFVPACVARKPNMSSLKYGFVTFPTVTEKEAAIIKFTGYELNGVPIKVEEIQDHKYRVKVPEKLVQYTVGEVKRTKEGGKNTMRKVSNSRETKATATSLSSSSTSSSLPNRKKQYNNQKKKLDSSSSMVGGGYKNMKKKENRKNRRQRVWKEDFGWS